ncbi:hypothetical protein KBB96_15310 [Luteolibacter ambystomatis]|uniref:Uncharacterized protein n=1 Tax=Luteolibacter ambystomatis TaxID=2824561 RepID=A0A975G6H8_9BACT|nr:hypothetical protein [Luteolibacter ambystomatis]QUE50232.1 hypothetical protein KBB96_15310 [Luteolibacter ambystomatis]
MKILDLTTDSLLLVARSPEVEVVHCQTGNAVMHSGCPKKAPRSAMVRLAFELLRGRRYDWVIVPPVHITWTTGNGFLRRQVKRIAAWFFKNPDAARFMRRVFFGSKARFAITDYSDQFRPSEFGLTCIEPDHYFMLNVPCDLVGTCMGPRNTLIHYLPTVMPDELIDSLGAQRTGPGGHDIFVAGIYHNEQRIKQREATQILAARGYKVFELGEKSFGKFTAGLLDSKLCMAGKGLAYHCFRPLEAAAAGAAPVVHGAEEGTYHDWVNGENCFLYDPELTAEGIADFVEEALRTPERILPVVEGARRLLNERHRASALASNLLRTFRGSE